MPEPVATPAESLERKPPESVIDVIADCVPPIDADAVTERVVLASLIGVVH